MGKVFEETYAGYIRRISGINLHSIAATLGAEISGNGIIVQLFAGKYHISAEGVVAFGDTDEPPFASRIVLCNYLLQCPDSPATEKPDWVSYRGFRDAAPLVCYFSDVVTGKLEKSFSGRIDILRQRCVGMGGSRQEVVGYDLSVQFQALPRIPLMLHFNERDEEFPAKCSMLFQSDAARYLDMECLALLASHLVEQLLSRKPFNNDHM